MSDRPGMVNDVSSDEAEKTRLRIGGLFGTDPRLLFTIEMKSSQIVGAYNYDGSPHHITKHEDGVLHEKSDVDNRVLWERLGQPLSTMTGPESLGTYSFRVWNKDALPAFKPERDDMAATLPMKEGERVDLAVVVFSRAEDRKLVSEISRRFSDEGMSMVIDPRSRIAIGMRRRTISISSQGV